MNRRAFLAAMATGGLAGCSSVPGSIRETPTPTETPVSGLSLAEQGNPPTVCEQGFVDLGIYAIERPAFADDWSGVDVREKYGTDGRLAPDDVVVGLVDGDRARAYPVSVLWVHEIVNDTFGTPVLVTYCSLCRSGMVARRVVDGDPTVFGVTGQLWEPPRLRTRASEDEGRVFAATSKDPSPGKVRSTGNLVMFDQATGSYWSQLLARGICGVHEGDDLDILPASVTTWREWRDANPDTDVLLPPPHSELMELPG